MDQNLDESGDFGQTKNDILDCVFVQPYLIIIIMNAVYDNKHL